MNGCTPSSLCVECRRRFARALWRRWWRGLTHFCGLLCWHRGCEIGGIPSARTVSDGLDRAHRALMAMRAR